MDTNKMRDVCLEQFKSWKGYPIPDLNSDGQFDKEYLQREWQAWQASRAAQVVTLPPLPAMPEPDEFATDDSHMDVYNAIKLFHADCARAIEAAGGRVAP